MRHEMTTKILVTILAVRKHYEASAYDHEIRLDYGKAYKTKDYGYAWEEAEKYFKSLPMPEGMDHSRACFEAIMSYPVYGAIMNAEQEEYGNYEFRY